MHPRTTLLLLSLAFAGRLSAQAEVPRDLLLITIDTLRADHLSCNGAETVQTPHLDRLAREGVNFTRVRAPVPLTLPAHASILTGNYPPTHTVRSNGEFVLPDEQVSLAEVLSDRGFRSAGFVSSFVLDRRFGVAQGFEHYDDRVWTEVDEIEKLEAERTADEVFTVFDEWLEAGDGVLPVFVWLHLYDPHAPYDPPEPFRTRFARDPYSGEVAYVDHVVGRILDKLESLGKLDSTLIAVVGDHGEGLGDHGEQTHSLLIYNSTLHVPMILWGPEVLPQGRRVDDLVRIIDLAPTLLDYLGVQRGFGEGVSLRPWIEGDTEATSDANLTAYSESIYPELALGWSPLRGLEGEDYRLILAPTPELYAMDGDPAELDNRATVDADSYQSLKRQLAEVIRAFEERGMSHSGSTGTVDEETRARLESLGYVAASGRTRARPGAPLDPKDGIELWNQIQLGIGHLGRGDPRAAAAIFESVLLSDPDIPLVYEYLGTSWQRMSEVGKAEKVYRAALERGIESPQVHHELARILAQKDHQEEAEQELQIALALDPQSVVAHYDLGNLYRSRKQLDRASEHYRRALELNPSYLWAWNGLAMALESQGRTLEAEDAFRRVVEIDPEGAPGVYNLAVHLERSGLTEEAATTYRRFLELDGVEGLEAQKQQANEALRRLSNP